MEPTQEAPAEKTTGTGTKVLLEEATPEQILEEMIKKIFGAENVAQECPCDRCKARKERWELAKKMRAENSEAYFKSRYLTLFTLLNTGFGKGVFSSIDVFETNDSFELRFIKGNRQVRTFAESKAFLLEEKATDLETKFLEQEAKWSEKN